MKISVITPTQDRPEHLKGLERLLKKQSYPDWEWWIYDGSARSLTFEDQRIHYIHDPEIVSMGEKRNRMLAQAEGELVVQFDDDDYYAPTYLETVAKALEEADFFCISSWFNYFVKAREYYYWDTTLKGETHFVLDPMTGLHVREVAFTKEQEERQEKMRQKGTKAYGFSYAYRKKVWECCLYDDADLLEDRYFFNKVSQHPFKIHRHTDRKGIAIHIVHEMNISKVYPQYRIPSFLMEGRLPDFEAFIESYPDEN